MSIRALAEADTLTCTLSPEICDSFVVTDDDVLAVVDATRDSIETTYEVA